MSSNNRIRLKTSAKVTLSAETDFRTARSGRPFRPKRTHVSPDCKTLGQHNEEPKRLPTNNLMPFSIASIANEDFETTKTRHRPCPQTSTRP